MTNGNDIGIILKALLDSDKSGIEQQIRDLSSKIKERLELKLKINADDLEVITKKVDEVYKKAKQKEKQPLKFGSLEETSQDMQRVMSDLERIQQHFNNLGKNVQVKQVFDGANESLKKFEVSVDTLNGKLKETQKFNVNVQTDKSGNTSYGYSKIAMDSKTVAEAKVKETTATKQQITTTKQATQEISKYEQGLNNLIHLYKMKEVADDEFLSTMEQLRSKTEFTTLSQQKQERVVSLLTQAEKNYQKVADQGSNINKKQSDDNAQREQAELKYWSQRRKESVENLTSKNTEIQKMKEYYSQLEKTSQAEAKKTLEIKKQLSLYKQKMLGGNGYSGELDIFAEKQSGKFDENALSKIRADIQALNILTPDLNHKIKQTNIEFSSLKQKASESGDIMVRALENAGKFLRFYLVGGFLVGFVNTLKSSIDTIRQLDTSLTELSKVTELSKEDLKDFTVTAYNLGETLGRTGKEVIDASAEFARAGYNIKDSLALSEQALLLTNIGDGMDNVKESASSLIAILRGYNLEATSTTHIVDLLNEVSNRYAVDTNNLTDGLQRTSGTLSQTGTSMEQLTGLLTGGYESLRNMEKVSSGLITISSRLRGMSEDGEEIDGLLPSLQKSFKELANVDIQTTNGQLRSTYDILSDMSEVWGTLNDEQKQYLGELASGKRQAPVLNAILQNWKNVEGATESAINSLGSATKENEKYLNSIEGKTKLFSSSVQQMWFNTINSDVIKFFVDTGTSIIKLIDKVGLLGTAIISVFTYLNLTGKIGLISLFDGWAIAAGRLTMSLTGSATAASLLSTAISTLAPVAVIGAIMGVIKLIQYLGEYQERQIEKINELKKEYDDLSDVLTQNKDKIKEVTERLTELYKLRANGTIADKEKEELDKLEKTNQALKEQIAYEQALIKIKGVALEEKTLKASQAKTELGNKTIHNEFLGSRQERITVPQAISEELAELQDYQSQLDNINTTQDKYKKELIELEKDYTNNAKAIKNTTKEIDKLEKSKSKLTQSINNRSSSLETLINKLEEENKKYIGATEAGNVKKKVNEELIKIAKQYIVSVGQTENAYSSLSKETEKVSKSTGLIIEKTKELDDIYKDTTSNLKDLNQAIYDIAQGESFSAEQIEELILKYPELEKYVRKTADGYTIEKSAIEILNKVRGQSVNTALLAQAGITQAAYDGLKDRLKAYKMEIESISSLADAYKAMMPFFASGSTNPQIIKDVLAYGEALDKIKTLKTTLEDPTYGVKEKKEEKTDTEIKTIETDQFYKLQEAIDRTNNSIENNKKLLSNTDDVEQQIEIIEKLISLYKEQQKQLHNIAEAKRDSIEDNVSKLEGYGFDVTYDRNSNDLRIANEEKINEIYGKNNKATNELRDKIKDIIKQTKEWNKDNIDAGSEWQNLAGNIKGAYGDIADIYKKQSEDSAKTKDEEKKLYEDSNKTVIDLLKKRYENEKKEREKNHKDKIEQYDSELDAFKKYVDTQTEEIDRLYDTEKYNKNVSNKSKEITDIQDKIDRNMMAANSGDLEAIAQIKELNKEKLKLETELQDTQKDREKDLRKQNLKDSLNDFEELIDSKKKAENKSFEDYQEQLEKSMSETALALEAEKMLMIGTVTEVQNSLKQLFTDVGENATALGKTLQKELIDKVAQLQNIGGELGFSTSSTPNMSNLLKTSTDLVLKATKSFMPNAVSNMVNNYITNQAIPTTNSNSNSVSIGDINVNVAKATPEEGKKLGLSIVSAVQNVMFNGGIKR